VLSIGVVANLPFAVVAEARESTDCVAGRQMIWRYVGVYAELASSP
jgi:hypothetical protein